MKIIKEGKRGITLIALVVTIIVLLILAGISIKMLTGDNGILQRATDAKIYTDNEQIKERIKLAYHSALTGGQGSYTKNTLMDELKKEFKTDYDVDDSDNEKWKMKAHGQEVEIPAGLKNNDESKYAPYDNPYIPANFSHVGTEEWNEGFTIRGNVGTANTGDEFVWVPCVLDHAKVKKGDTVQIFTKITTDTYNLINSTLHPSGGTNEDVNLEDSTVAEIRTSVGTYGGFYIAKYEAGITGDKDNRSLDTKTVTDGSVKPLSQAGKGVWNLINRADCLTVSKAMIPSSTGAKSTLISGECWDTTLQWIKQTTNTNYDIDSTGKGNYVGNLATTAASTDYAINGIYDMAGNVSEYTSENCLFYDEDYDQFDQISICRGGYFINDADSHPASCREGFAVH